MTCPRCGTEDQDSAAVCPKCGFVFAASPRDESGPPPISDAHVLQAGVSADIMQQAADYRLLLYRLRTNGFIGIAVGLVLILPGFWRLSALVSVNSLPAIILLALGIVLRVRPRPWGFLVAAVVLVVCIIQSSVALIAIPIPDRVGRGVPFEPNRVLILLVVLLAYWAFLNLRWHRRVTRLPVEARVPDRLHWLDNLASRISRSRTQTDPALIQFRIGSRQKRSLLGSDAAVITEKRATGMTFASRDQFRIAAVDGPERQILRAVIEIGDRASAGSIDSQSFKRFEVWKSVRDAHAPSA